MKFVAHWIVRYSLAVVIILVATALRLAFIPVMGYSIPYLTIFPAMTFIAVTLGVGPGVLTTVVGVLLAEVYLMSPGSPIEFNLSFLIRLAIMLLTSFYVGWVSERLRQALARADAEIGSARAAEESRHASEKRLIAVYASMTEGIANHEIVYEDEQAVDYIITDVNPAYEQITSLTRHDAVGKKASDLYGIRNPPYLDIYARVAAGGAPEQFETYFAPMQKHFTISVFSPKKGQFATVFADISARKHAENILQVRMRLMEFAATHSLEEILQETLDEVGKITDSPIGFYHFVEADQQTLSLQTWSTRTLQEFCTAQGKGLHYNISEAGVWADCIRQRRPVIHNDYALLPNRKGLPGGHAQVIRELVVPILRSDRIVSILGVGNKPSNYTEKDVEIVSYLADVAWEIAERKRAEEHLERSHQKLNEILGSIRDDFYVLDRDWNFVYASRLFTSKIGKEPEDFVGNNIWEMFPKHVGTILEQNFREAMEKRETRRFEIGGKYTSAWYRMTAFPSIDGITVLGTDITEHKRAEEYVTYQARLLASVNDAIVGSDAQYKLNTWNACAETLYGWKAEEVLGRNGVEILQTEWPQQDADVTRQMIAATGRWRGEATQLRKDGLRIPVEVSSIVLRDENDQITGYVSVNRDITERKQAEEKLARQAEELRRSNTELEQFAYVASHDLQEPLRIMSSYSQLLERRYRGQLDQDADDFIGFIVEAAARMQKLITDLLAYSRAGHEKASLVEVDCNRIVRKLVDGMSMTIEAADGCVTYDQLPVLITHESSLFQLFQNLIGNALKFRGEQPCLIHISARPVGDEWVFSVSDNGIGIEPQYNQRIFMIFQRLHPREKYPGTGIGLSICKKIVENLGGRIWVESEPGHGSSFIFTVPIRSATNPLLEAE